METTGTMQMDFEYYDDLFFMVQASKRLLVTTELRLMVPY